MEVICAQTAGFCFGVKRAVDTVYDLIQKGDDNIYTYGPIIHNEQVVCDLEKKGVKVLSDEAELKDISGGVVVIRSHGAPPQIYELIKDAGAVCVDATCPFVKKIHKIVEEESTKGNQVIVIGTASHPEVRGIIGWCDPKYPAIVIENHEEANLFSCSPQKNICIVSQTTANRTKFQEIVDIFRKKGYNIRVVNTICNATEERQAEAAQIAGQVDAMIVIGGRNSSNTQKLFEICSHECNHTQYIQTLDDLIMDSSESLSRVGITAGASTPKKIIEEVQNYVRINF